MAVLLYCHRNGINYRSSIGRNIVFELFRIKFIHPEYFTITSDFLKAVKINQLRFWQLDRGETKPTNEEYCRLASALGITMQEAFDARQLELFNDEKNDTTTNN